MQFASDEFYYALKAAHAARDRNLMGELLWPHVVRSSRYWFAKRKETFAGYTWQDQDDAMQEAFLYVMQTMDDFLAQPGNDPAAPEEIRYSPAQKRSFFFQTVYNGLRKIQPHVQKHNVGLSIDQPVGEGAEQTLGDILPSVKWSPERSALARNEMITALRDLFLLPNDVDTLVSIGYIILNDTLGDSSVTLEQYAAFLNGNPVSEVARSLEKLLLAAGAETDVLAPVWRRLGENRPTFENVTAQKLANRKNSIINSMRKGRDPDDS